MSNKCFNWDRYFAEASFKDIRKMSPDLSSRRLPSAFSPDRKFLYLSSQDIDVQTNDPGQLKVALASIKISYAMANRAGQIDHRKAYVARTDCIAVCDLLTNCTDDPEEYADPDCLLGSASA